MGGCYVIPEENLEYKGIYWNNDADGVFAGGYFKSLCQQGGFTGVSNGDFALYTGTETADGKTIPAGSTELTGWTIEGQVRRIKSGASAWGSPNSVSGGY